jgi:hypothetical protein
MARSVPANSVPVNGVPVNGVPAPSVLDTKYGGSSLTAGAGPVGGGSAVGSAVSSVTSVVPMGSLAVRAHPRCAAAEPSAGLQGSTELTSAERDLYNYVSAHRDGASSRPRFTATS